MASPVTVNQDGKTAEPKPPVAPPA